ncbi:uncharacterized protein O3C94_000467 [Discoglossus pictus]
MAKRKAEHQLVTIEEPCKRRAWDIPASLSDLHTEHPTSKRKLEPDSEDLPTPECKRASREETPHTPCKRQRMKEPSIQCKRQREEESSTQCKRQDENDNDLSEYNSFQYWRVPLPKVDLSEITEVDLENHQKPTTYTAEEMDG